MSTSRSSLHARLAKLETVQMVLGHHTSDNFPFLDLVHSRYRTTFYQVNISCPLLSSLTTPIYDGQPHYAPHCSRQALGRLLMLESPEDVVRFERFMAPMATVLQVHVCAVSFLSIWHSRMAG